MPSELKDAINWLLRQKGFWTENFEPEVSETERYLRELLSLHCSGKWHGSVKFKTAFGEFFLDMGRQAVLNSCVPRNGQDNLLCSLLTPPLPLYIIKLTTATLLSR